MNQKKLNIFLYNFNVNISFVRTISKNHISIWKIHFFTESTNIVTRNVWITTIGGRILFTCFMLTISTQKYINNNHNCHLLALLSDHNRFLLKEMHFFLSIWIVSMEILKSIECIWIYYIKSQRINYNSKRNWNFLKSKKESPAYIKWNLFISQLEI